MTLNLGFLGDSGVGKTSFIQRFCTDNFKDTFSATIGVDLQVKMLNIDSRVVALQLWDTVESTFAQSLLLTFDTFLCSRPVKRGLLSLGSCPCTSFFSASTLDSAA